MFANISLEKKATIFSSVTAFVLTIMKLIVGIMSGSVALLSSAIDSVLDFGVSLFNYFAVSSAEKPADDMFNYGRGKIEALASVIEGTIITISGLFLLYEAIKKYITHESSQYLELSMIVMVISLVITFILVMFLEYVAKKTNNMVIKADALHYKTDVYTNIAVLLSLAIVSYSGYEIFDILIGGGIAVFIIYSAYELIQDGILMLLDRSIDESIVTKIKEIITSHNKINDYHFLKTREAGKFTFVDVHIVFDEKISLYDAHSVSDEIEQKIRDIDSEKIWIINTHLDPYDDSVLNEEVSSTT
jgi:cation diffusion facilitator family transporter